MLVTRRDIFPADHGGAVAIERLAWGLSRAYGRVWLVTDDRRRYFTYLDGVRTELAYPRRYHMGAPRSLLRGWMRGRGVPASEAFLYTPACDRSLTRRALFVARRHGVTAFEGIYPAFGLPCLACRAALGGVVVQIEHNVEYHRLEEQAPTLSRRGARFVRGLELRVCAAVDAVVTVSDADRERLVADGIRADRVHTIPHGVDLSAFDGPPADVRARLGLAPSTRLLVYHGIYSYAPNREAMEFMAARILPALRAAGVSAKVVAIGREPPSAPLDADIIFTGPVDSVAPWLLAADVAVVPLRSGGGTRMKVLDYFAARLPVVSTGKGVEGIPITPGREYVRADEPDRFAAEVARMLTQAGEAAAVAARGRAFVERLDWLEIARRHAALLESLGAGAKRPQRAAVGAVS
jgi:glycosyltransferase involved in cell wall biosynthesis